MAKRSSRKSRPFVQLDAKLLQLYLPRIGPNGLAVYACLKLHENRRTGQCNPSYQTLADEIGISRPTVIKYAYMLEALKLVQIRPVWTALADRSSNQYDLTDPHRLEREPMIPIPPPEGIEGGGQVALPPPGGFENELNPGGQSPLPYPEVLNQKERTKESDVENRLHEKQLGCAHPNNSVHDLGDGVIICNDCFGLLDAAHHLLENWTGEPVNGSDEGDPMDQPLSQWKIA